jgi:hypothetical protein
LGKEGNRILNELANGRFAVIPAMI